MNQLKVSTPLVWVIVLTCVANKLYCQHAAVKFTHFFIDRDLQPASWGTGGFTVNDFDNDGDMDVTIQKEGAGKVYWYQNLGAGRWQKNEIASDIHHQLGATSIDVNKDGNPDLVMGTYWLENPGNLLAKPALEWPKHDYNGAMTNAENHDIVAADINHDGIQDIVAYSQNWNGDNGTLRWYDITNPAVWKYHDIDTFVNKREIPAWNKGVHAGFAPNGIGDLNNDGWVDIVMPQGWYENPKNNTAEWILHRWRDYGLTIGIANTPYGTAIRSWISDINHDGNNDIVITHSDVENSKAYILYNSNAAGDFTLQALPLPDGPSGSFHSLGVADLNNDGLLDIFSGEQEDPDKGMKPAGLKERGIVWINTGTNGKPAFRYQVINTDNPGWHETVLADVDGDGDIDLVTKVWNADEGTDSNPDRKWHIDYWRNDTKDLHHK